MPAPSTTSACWGRLGSDVIDDLDAGPQESLRSSGASDLQILAYGVLPQVLPQFVTFLLYRWEVIIRASAVVGFVTAAGLGYQLRLGLSFFRYTDVALLLAIYICWFEWSTWPRPRCVASPAEGRRTSSYRRSNSPAAAATRPAATSPR